ncbi:hypothetical protein VSAK1_07884 [Vibrio mediterranei AK1]|nr:hypothetical protein VSAK1_07884 [Vibrio mediterranei AK1]
MTRTLLSITTLGNVEEETIGKRALRFKLFCSVGANCVANNTRNRQFAQKLLRNVWDGVFARGGK